MKIITRATVEPISIELARKQCKVDPDPTLSPPTHEDDELIMLYVGAAREYCEADLGMMIAPTIVELSFDAFADGDIMLESGPVLGVDGVTYTDQDGLELTVSEMVYYLDTRSEPSRLRLNTGQIWPSTMLGFDVVRVQYQIGYSASGASPQIVPLPNAVKVAMLLLLTHLYTNREATIEANLQEIPFGVKNWLSLFRIRLGFA